MRSGRDTDAVVAAPPARPEGHSIFAFPAGARTGKAWHALFEHLDLQAGEEDIRKAVESMLDRHDFGREFGPAMTGMVQTALTSPLGPDGVRLSTVGAESCARELDFVFACKHFRTAEFRALLIDPASGLHASFAGASASLRDRDIQGFMIGTIDLLFRHGERFYIIDYKSNNLGGDAGLYAPASLAAAMAREHYYLQYLIYTVAVHRYLRTRLPGYTYDTHFGGVMYLFLRGMTAGTQQGVFFDRPTGSLINALEARLFGGEVH